MPRRAAQALVALLAMAAWLGPAAVARAGVELVPGTPEQSVVDETVVSRVDPEATAVYTYDDELAKVGGVQPAPETPPADEPVTNTPVAPVETTGPQTVTIDVKPIPDAPKDTAPPPLRSAVAAARAGAVAEEKVVPAPARPEKPAIARAVRQAPKSKVGDSPQSQSLLKKYPAAATPHVSQHAADAELQRTEPPAVAPESNPAPSLPSLPERSPDSPGAPFGTGAAFGAIGGGAGGGLVVGIILSLFLFTAPAGLRKVRLPDVVLVAPLLARANARPG